MEITQIKVTVKTLTKNIFNQLEETRVWKDDEVVGWVNNNGDTVLLVQQYKGNTGQLKRVYRTAVWDRLVVNYRSCPVEKVREAVDNYFHKFEQVILG